MKTNVAPNSLDAFRAFDPIHLEHLESVILDLFKAPEKLGREPVALSRQQISRIKNLPINTVAGRVKGLLDKGCLIEDGNRIDPVTCRKQALLKLVTKDVEQ